MLVLHCKISHCLVQVTVVRVKDKWGLDWTVHVCTQGDVVTYGKKLSHKSVCPGSNGPVAPARAQQV